MAIVIVKPSGGTPEDKFHATCDTCGCVFNFQRADTNNLFVICPECKNYVTTCFWEKGETKWQSVVLRTNRQNFGRFLFSENFNWYFLAKTYNFRYEYYIYTCNAAIYWFQKTIQRLYIIFPFMGFLWNIFLNK